MCLSVDMVPVRKVPRMSHSHYEVSKRGAYSAPVASNQSLARECSDQRKNRPIQEARVSRMKTIYVAQHKTPFTLNTLVQCLVSQIAFADHIPS